MRRSNTTIIGFLELIALAVILAILMQIDTDVAIVVASLLCIVWLFTILTGMGLPRFKNRGKASLAFVITAFFVISAANVMAEKTEARLAELKTTDQTAYLALLKTHNEKEWLKELRTMDPERYSEVVSERRAKAQAEALNKRAEACSSGKEVMAYVMMQNPVKQRLKAPSTAKFPASMGKGTKHLGDCLYQVSGTFDAQNGFGAMIRGYFTGTIRYDPSDKTWQPLSLDIN